jgi:hypothetical protein
MMHQRPPSARTTSRLAPEEFESLADDFFAAVAWHQAGLKHVLEAVRAHWNEKSRVTLYRMHEQGVAPAFTAALPALPQVG